MMQVVLDEAVAACNAAAEELLGHPGFFLMGLFWRKLEGSVEGYTPQVLHDAYLSSPRNSASHNPLADSMNIMYGPYMGVSPNRYRPM